MTDALSPLDIFRATAILLSDRPPGPVDAIFFHARPRGDDDECFALAADYLQAKCARFIVITGSHDEVYGETAPGKVWDGATAYERRLQNLGVPSDTIVRSRPAFHAHEEARAYLAVARERRWENACILTLPHHIPRTFLGMVRAVARDQYHLRAYPFAPVTVNWWKQVPDAQGKGLRRRYDHIAEELERIARDQASGELATFDELRAYLDWRDD